MTKMNTKENVEALEEECVTELASFIRKIPTAEEIKKHQSLGPRKTQCCWGVHGPITCYPVLCPVLRHLTWHCRGCSELSYLCREAIDNDNS